MDGCDVVIHLAASADVGEVEKAPLEAETLQRARHRCTCWRRRVAPDVKRVVYASTIWVYSDACEPHGRRVARRCGRPRTSTPPPSWPASCTAAPTGELYGLEYTVLRFGIPYGPRARPAAVIPTFVGKALAGEPLTMAGDGRQSRRFVYVEDLADGVVRALCPTAADRVYNLVGAEDVTIARDRRDGARAGRRRRDRARRPAATATSRARR